MVSREVEAKYYIKDRPPIERIEDFRTADLPIAYWKVPKYKYKKGGNLFEELRNPELDEIGISIVQCFDVVSEGGKRDRGEVYDEKTKLLYAK